MKNEILVIMVYEDKDNLELPESTPAPIKSEIARSITSLKEVIFVKEELIKEGFDVKVYEISEFCSSEILKLTASKEKQAFVWNVTDGEFPFKGGSVPAVARLFGIPFLGSTSFVRGMCNAKHIWKSQVAHSVPVAPDSVIHSIDELISYNNELEYPLFIKPSRYGNSAGISLINPIVKKFNQLKVSASILLENQLQPVLIETFLSGTEYAVAALHTDKWHLKAFKSI